MTTLETVATCDRQTTRSRRATQTMVVAMMAWGLSTVANKLCLDRTHMRPMSLQAIQISGSIAVLILITVMRRNPTPSRQEWRDGRVGILEPGASDTLALVGLSMTAATHASIIGALEPSLVVLLAWLLLHERVSSTACALMALTLGGSVLVVTNTTATNGQASGPGDGLLTASVVCAAAYIMFSSRRAQTGRATTTLLTQQLWAMVIIGPALGLSVTLGGLGPTPIGTGWFYVMTSMALSYLIPFGLYLKSAGPVPPLISAQLLALIPLSGLAGAAIILGEPITGRAFIGALTVVAAVVLLARTNKPTDRHAT
jgi:drug/metabolite transporter (DMT)-like permease